MADIYSLLTEKNGQGISITQYGYEDAPEIALFGMDFKDLNKQDLDFRSANIKSLAKKMTVTPDGEKIYWYDEDMRKDDIAITTRSSATSWIVDSTAVKVGDTWRNKTTGNRVIVIAVSGSTITLAGAGDTSSLAGDTLTWISNARGYKTTTAYASSRNDLNSYDNYFQYNAYEVSSEIIKNNDTKLFFDNPNEFQKTLFGDASRDSMRGYGSSFYFGIKAKTTISGYVYYTAGGVEYYLPGSCIVDLSGDDDPATKANLRRELITAYASGLSGIFGRNKLLAMCTSKFKSEIDRLYEDKVEYTDKLDAIDVDITTYNVGGRKLNMVESTLLNTEAGDEAVAYLIPVDYCAVFVLPYGTQDISAKSVEKMGVGQVFLPPQTNPAEKSAWLFSTHTFEFKGITSGAYRKIYFSKTSY